MSKRKREPLSEDALQRNLDQAIADKATAELAVIYLMHEYDFDFDQLKLMLSEKGLNASFSRVTYMQIAHYVGLDPLRKLADCPQFELRRSRIPSSIFKSILEDMDVMLVQYGSMDQQANEEARSRFLAPIFNRLVATFAFAVQNTPESMMEGRITRKGRIEHHFKTFGAVAILFVEFKATSSNLI